MTINLFKEMSKDLVNLKKMITSDVLEDKKFSDLKLIRFSDCTDNRLPTKNKVGWYWLVFSKKNKYKENTIFFSMSRYDNGMGKMDILDLWDFVIVFNMSKPYTEFKLKTKEEVLSKIREYLTVFMNDTTSLKEAKIKLETELKLLKWEKSKEIKTLNEKIKEIDSLLNENK